MMQLDTSSGCKRMVSFAIIWNHGMQILKLLELKRIMVMNMKEQAFILWSMDS